ncbi:MAG: hypothetical protein J6E38_07400 [Clostridia bacterium]|nr:hypothetical protein [Clostridia bacterium]
METKRINEDLKPNEVNAAYLFLGIGGAGCDIVKRIAKRCHPAERENISFLCMDTDVNDLKRIKDELPFVHIIQTSTTQTVGAFLDNDEDARKRWFPKSAVMYDKTMSEGAGQVRAISRLAVDATIKTGRIRPLYDAIDSLFRKTGKELKQSMRCIIASSSSGGTGSGMILPISMFIRNYVKEKYPNAALLTRALLLLPETLDSVIDSQTERDSQARNGYATIKELNAFMMKGSGFVDLDPDLWQYRDLHVDVPIAGSDKLKSLSTLPIDFCFLMDGQDAEDSTLTSYEQYKEQASIALYEQNIGPMQRKAASTEDNIIKELAKSRGRNRFGGIGAGIVRYPYERIVDYVACDLAADSIGGEGESSKWTRYDKAHKLYMKEQKKRGQSLESSKKLGEFYIEHLDSSAKSGGDSFSKDMVGVFLENIDERVEMYMANLDAQIEAVVSEDPTIFNVLNAASSLCSTIDYTNPENSLSNNIDSLIAYRNKVKEKAKDGSYKVADIARRFIEGVFTNERPTTIIDEDYSIEKLLKNSIGDVSHPCAARYIIYKLKSEFEERLKQGDHLDAAKALEATENAEYSFKFVKNSVTGLEGLRELEKENPSLVDKMKGYNSLFETANEALPNYFRKAKAFCNEEAKHAAYEKAYSYIKAYAEEYESFFGSFEEKVKRLSRVKDDIANELKYKKGDSVMNICSDGDVLAELSRTSLSKISQESTLLSSEINGAIFDQVKKNAVFNMERAIAGDDLSIENRHKDIFDDILMGYFKDEICEKCEEINVDVINSIVLEYKLIEGLKARANGTEFIFKQSDAESYLKTKIAMGSRIAAPSIQRMLNVEPREINRCAYNTSLTDNRQFNVKVLLEKGDPCESVSKYEIRFFNALYNVTPDKLKKFAAPYTTETGKKESGTYHKAYHSYSKSIGPDSTKNAAMSTHIDKRWDSIKVMPEIDDEYQQNIILDIHKAFIYGIVHDAIQHNPLSLKAGGKLVYNYKNSIDRFESLVVSNGTLCDEFYEILDALYVNAKVVEDINEVVKQRKRAMSIMKNCNYEETEFFKDMANFDMFTFYDGKRKAAPLSAKELSKLAEEIQKNALEKKNNPDFEGRFTENTTSLFAIPLIYYYSLPNSSRYISELNAMVDAVISVFREEYETWEKEEDVKFVLCDRLVNEFDLLQNNYHLYVEHPEINVPERIEDNEVLDVIRRKIQEEVRSAPEPEDYETLLDHIAKRSR